MKLPAKAAVMTLPSATLFPQTLLPLHIFEPHYRRMLADALRADRMFSIAMQRPDVLRESPCPIAGLGLIRASVSHADGTSHLWLQGLTRVELLTPVQTAPYRVHSIRPLVAAAVDNVVVDALVAKVHELVAERLRLGTVPLAFPEAVAAEPLKAKKGSGKQAPSAHTVLRYLERLSTPGDLADLVSGALLSDPRQRQTILETLSVEQRLRHLIKFLLADIKRLRKQPEL